MAEIEIQAKLQGGAVEDNTVPLRLLADFSTDFQKTVDHIAYRLNDEAKKDKNIVRRETSLRVAATEAGSFKLIMRPEYGNGVGSLATRALMALVSGLIEIRASQEPVMPAEYDQGVLQLLLDIGKIFRKKISAIEFNLKTPDLDQTVIYDYAVYNRVKELVEAPEERIEALEGNLLEVNFKGNDKDEFKLRLYLPNEAYVSCSFEEELSGDVQKAVRHFVHIIGLASINPVTDQVTSINIEKITVLDLAERPSEDDLREITIQLAAERDTLAEFRQAFREALTGDTLSLSEMWDELDAE